MAHCYNCGCPLPTGAGIRTRVISASHGRIVNEHVLMCSRCSRNSHETHMSLIGLSVIVVFLVAVVVQAIQA